MINLITLRQSFVSLTAIILLLGSASAASQEPALAMQAQTETNTNSVAESESCPSNFFQVPIPESGKLCQIFATDMPASMVFFVPQTIQSVVDFYANKAQFDAAEQSLERFLINSKDKNVTVIVSADGTGTQVDVLVKQDPSE